MKLLVVGYDYDNKKVFENLSKVYKQTEPQLDHVMSEVKAQYGDSVKRVTFELFLDPLSAMDEDSKSRTANSLRSI